MFLPADLFKDLAGHVGVWVFRVTGWPLADAVMGTPPDRASRKCICMQFNPLCMCEHLRRATRWRQDTMSSCVRSTYLPLLYSEGTNWFGRPKGNTWNLFRYEPRWADQCVRDTWYDEYFFRYELLDFNFFQFWVRTVRHMLIIMARRNLQNPVPTSAVEIACVDTVALMCYWNLMKDNNLSVICLMEGRRQTEYIQQAFLWIAR